MSRYVYAPHYDFYIDKAVRDRGYSMPSFHMHNKYELYYQLSGSRRYVIQDGAYFINAGSLVVIDKTEIHKTVSLDDDRHSRYVLNFSESYLASIQAAMEETDLFQVFHSPRKVLNLTLRQRAIVEMLLAQLYALKDTRSARENDLRKLNLAELLTQINLFAAELTQAQAESPKVLNRVVCELTNYVSAHYQEELSLAQLAGQLRLSPCYVSRVFKRETGTCLMEFIGAVRLKAARELLETTKLSIGQIAERSGFTTTGHFTLRFREACGMPPGEYRRRYGVNP